MTSNAHLLLLTIATQQSYDAAVGHWRNLRYSREEKEISDGRFFISGAAAAYDRRIRQAWTDIQDVADYADSH